MSKTRVVLGISLALNLILVALFAMPSNTLRAISYAAVSHERAAIRTAAHEAAHEDRQAPPAAAATAIGSPDVQRGTARGEWTEQVRHHVAELRRRGVDENTVRLLGVALAERFYRLRARELLKPPPPSEVLAGARDDVLVARARSSEGQRISAYAPRQARVDRGTVR